MQKIDLDLRSVEFCISFLRIFGTYLNMNTFWGLIFELRYAFELYITCTFTIDVICISALSAEVLLKRYISQIRLNICYSPTCVLKKYFINNNKKFVIF